jgi:hypothetical protein
MLHLQTKINPIASVRNSISSNIAGQIYFTTDYNIFKELLGNRDLDEKHVKNLIKSMKEEYLEIPIQVNEKMEVIDGQHRLAACKELKLPVYFNIIKEAGLQQTLRQNALQKKWVLNDVLESYVKLGYKDYIVVKSFVQKYKFSIMQTLYILSLSTRNGTGVKKFREGKVTINDVNKSHKIAKLLYDLSEIVNIYDYFIFYAFFVILTKCQEFDVYVFIEKMKYQSQKFKKQRNVKFQIELIEEIYNYKSRTKVNLRIIQ